MILISKTSCDLLDEMLPLFIVDELPAFLLKSEGLKRFTTQPIRHHFIALRFMRHATNLM